MCKNVTTFILVFSLRCLSGKATIRKTNCPIVLGTGEKIKKICLQIELVVAVLPRRTAGCYLGRCWGVWTKLSLHPPETLPNLLNTCHYNSDVKSRLINQRRRPSESTDGDDPCTVIGHETVMIFSTKNHWLPEERPTTDCGLTGGGGSLLYWQRSGMPPPLTNEEIIHPFSINNGRWPAPHFVPYRTQMGNVTSDMPRRVVEHTSLRG